MGIVDLSTRVGYKFVDNVDNLVLGGSVDNVDNLVLSCPTCPQIFWFELSAGAGKHPFVGQVNCPHLLAPR